MEILEICTISLVLNIDALLFGITFGIKNIKICLVSKMIIFITSFSITLISYLLGKYVSIFLNKNISYIISSAMMIFLGLALILKTAIDKEDSSKKKMLVNLNLHSLGLTIKIIKEPTASDIDKSGTIEAIEAIFIAIALSLDALSATFSLSLCADLKIYTIFLIPTIQFIALSAGNLFGQRLKFLQKNL